MRNQIIVTLLLAALLGTPALGHTHPRPYVLREQPIMTKDLYGPGLDQDHLVLRLYRRHARRPIWTGAVTDMEYLTWSANGRALIGCGQPYPRRDSHLSLFVWRENGGWRRVHDPSFDHWAYFWDFHWSPDGRIAAFRAGGSGDKDLNVGQLSLYDSARNKLLSAPKTVAGQVEWIGLRTLRYWPRIFHERVHGNDIEGGFVTGKPRLWHVRLESGRV